MDKNKDYIFISCDAVRQKVRSNHPLIDMYCKYLKGLDDRNIDEVNDYVEVHGRISVFNGALQMSFDRARRTSPEMINPADYLPVSPKSIDEMYRGLLNHVESVKTPYYRLLMDKAIAGAVLDVLDNEPPTAEDLKFLDCPNTIVTPHMCGATYEVTNHQADILNARLRQWLAGENLQKIVYNKDVLA